MKLIHSNQFGHRPLVCGGYRRKNARSRQATITCEKPALHGHGCLITDEQLAKHPEVGLRRILTLDAQRHAGRDKTGKWHFWLEER